MTDRKLFNPFPGLRPFGAEEDYLFFGREEQTRELLQLLRTHRFLAVVGTSGSGKSSLVRAGLLPALYGGTMVGVGSDWSTVVFRPGGDPLLNMAEAMIEADLYDPDDEEAPLRIRATLSRSRLGLVQSVKQSDLPEGTNLLIVVDQFEELFRFRGTSPEHQGRATAFVKLLLNAVADPELPIYVAITMRSDYLGDCAQLPGLAEAVNDGEYLIPKLTRDQKRDAIEKPVSVGGGQISPALVQQLLNDVGDDSDQLPILQHVLMRIWDQWETDHDNSEPIDLRHYDTVGGMDNALSLHADEVHDELPDDNSRHLAMRVFQAITERGDDERGTRRPTRLGELCDIVNGSQDEVTVVLDAYRQAGRTFVMPGQEVPLQPETVIDISHESLMRVWQRLKGWVAEESQAVRIYRRLAETAALHAAGEAGVYRDPDLQIATSWRDSSEPTEAWAQRYHAGFDTAMTFLHQSWETAHAEEEAREAARQRELEQAKKLADSERKRAAVQARAKKRLYVLLAGISAALMVAVGMYIYAEGQRELAETNRQQAVANAETATRNEELAKKNATEAERNAEEAKRQETIALKNADEAKTQAQLAEQARAEARNGLYRSQMLIAHQSIIQGESFEQAARLLDEWRPRSGEDDIRGWEWHYLNSLRETDGQFISTTSIWHTAADWSPVSDHLVAYGAGDGSIVLYDVAKDEEIRRMVGHTRRLNALRFSRDGTLLVSGSRDNTVRVWDVQLGIERQNFSGHSGAVHTVDFSTDKNRIVSSSFDRTARIWEISTGKLVNTLECLANSPAVSRWSPSSEWIATGIGDHEIRIRNSRTLDTIKSLRCNSPVVTALDWSSDSKLLACGTESGDVEILDVTTGTSVMRLSGHNARVLSIRWTPDDKRLISGGSDGIVRIWNATSGTLTESFDGQVFGISDVAWSPDGRSSLINGVSGRLRIKRPEVESNDDSKSPHTGVAASVAWHPSQNLLAYGGDDRLLHVVSMDNTNSPSKLPGHTGKINAVCFSPGGKWIASGGGDNSLRIWDTALLKAVSTFDDLEADVQSLAWSPDGKRLAVGLGKPNTWAFGNVAVLPNSIVILDVTDPGKPRVEHTMTAHLSVLTLAWNSTSDQLATAGISHRRDEERIRIWDAETGAESGKLTLPLEVVFDLDWTDADKTLVIGTRNSLGQGFVKFLKVEDGSVQRMLEGHDGVYSVALNRDGTRLLTAGKDRSVKVWDRNSGAEVLTIANSTSAVFSAAWSWDDTQIAAVGAELGIFNAYSSFLEERSPSLLLSLNEKETKSGLSAIELLARAELHTQRNDWDAAAADLVAYNQPLDQPSKWFIMPWRIQGPYNGGMNQGSPIDLAKEYDPFETDPGTLANSLENWQSIHLKPDGFLDMAAYTDGAETCSCFAITRIYSTSDQQVAFLMGTDDSHRIWLNGEMVDEFFGNRPPLPDQDVLLAELKSGWNTILFKVHNGFGGHGFYFRITDEPLQIAWALNRNGQYKEAVDAWDKLVADHPENISFRVARLQAALLGVLPERATVDIEFLGNLVPENNELQSRRSEVAATQGRLQDAISALSNVITRSGGSPEQLIRRGELHRLIGNYDDAAADVVRSIATNKTVVLKRSRISGSRMLNRAAAAIGQIELVKSGRNKASVPWRYTFDSPDNSWTTIEFDDAGWERGLSPFGSGNNSKTDWPTEQENIWLRHEFQVDTVPTGQLRINAFIDDGAEFYINGVRVAQGRWIGNKRQDLRLAIDKASPLRKGKNVLAVMCQNVVFAGLIDVALYVDNPDPQAMVGLLERAQTAAPDDQAINILRGKQLILNQRWSEASDAYRKGIDSVAQDHWSWYESIGLEWLLGNQAEMQSQVDRMFERFRDDSDPTIVRRTANRGVYSDMVKVDPEVLDRMTKMFVEGQPNNGFTHFIHAVVLFRKGDLSAAHDTLVKARGFAPGWNWVFHSMTRTFQARIAFRQGNLDQALLNYQNVNRVFSLNGPKSHKDQLQDFWIDQMAVMLMIAEAGHEIVTALQDKQELTLTERRLLIQALLGIARRHEFAQQHSKFLDATRKVLDQMMALVKDENNDTDRQRAMCLVWDQLNADAEFQLPHEIVTAALETLFPPNSLEIAPAQWTPLKPLAFESTNNVAHVIEPDHSIVIPHGKRMPKTNDYTALYEMDVDSITGLRIEFIRDRRLAWFGPGHSAGSGNIAIENLGFSLSTDGTNKGQPFDVASASAAFWGATWESGDHPAGKMFDDDNTSFFNVWPKVGRSHAVIARLGQSVLPADEDQLKVTIGCNHPQFGWHTLGRFRVSVTSSTTGLKVQRCWDDKAPQSVSYWSIWATRLMNENKFKEAKPWIERAFNDSEPATAFDWLVAARFHRRTGDTARADKLYQDALQWSSSYGKGLPILERQLKLAAPAGDETATNTPSR